MSKLHASLACAALVTAAIAACGDDTSTGTGSGGGATATSSTTSGVSTNASSTSASSQSSGGDGGDGGNGGDGTGGPGAGTGGDGTGGPGAGTGGAGGDGGSGTGGADRTCEQQGGICIGAGECEPQNGTVGELGGCVFDDGPAECCIPPQPAPQPSSCENAGGLCAPIGGCRQADGYITTDDEGCDNGPSFVCCVPHDYCGDADFECCQDNQTVFMPACNSTQLECVVGEPVPVDTCLADG